MSQRVRFKYGEPIAVALGPKARAPLPTRVLFQTMCRSCGTPMLMVRTPAGARMPVNLPDATGTFTSHHATCPQGRAWSRAKAATVADATEEEPNP